jgi:putative colanic acid biosynthesis acetyltransferase WcaF
MDAWRGQSSQISRRFLKNDVPIPAIDIQKADGEVLSDMPECPRAVPAAGLDIAANRRAPRYARGILIRRLLWSFGKWALRLSPRPCFGWRRFVLRSFGAHIGTHVHIYPSARVYFPWNLTAGDWTAIGEDCLIYNLGPVLLGEKVTISHRAHLCAGTHDYQLADLPIRMPPIMVKNQAWICADAFIGPGVTIGEGAVVGARAVVMRNVEPWTVVAGNPATYLKDRQLRSAASAAVPRPAGSASDPCRGTESQAKAS